MVSETIIGLTKSQAPISTSFSVTSPCKRLTETTISHSVKWPCQMITETSTVCSWNCETIRFFFYKPIWPVQWKIHELNHIASHRSFWCENLIEILTSTCFHGAFTWPHIPVWAIQWNSHEPANPIAYGRLNFMRADSFTFIVSEALEKVTWIPARACILFRNMRPGQAAERDWEK